MIGFNGVEGYFFNNFVAEVVRKICYRKVVSWPRSGASIRNCGRVRTFRFALRFCLWRLGLVPVPLMFLAICLVTYRGRRWRKRPMENITCLWKTVHFSRYAPFVYGFAQLCERKICDLSGWVRWESARAANASESNLERYHCSTLQKGLRLNQYFDCMFWMTLF